MAARMAVMPDRPPFLWNYCQHKRQGGERLRHGFDPNIRTIHQPERYGDGDSGGPYLGATGAATHRSDIPT